ncbi:MAG TPA: glutamyl-tRNA reductase [Syntrophales bacterium]|nr:glutamyl-tRNA reductase [Syntrophales bacterium]HOL59425.1 glutamyl-tRNA reductase [Syntrophales bacterium]HPO35582.1 glutamyl-tRNA reductase [Syntrophales bacterium]
MNIILVGSNHKTTPLEVRERLAPRDNESPHPLMALRSLPSVQEAFFLATCNRVEVLAVVSEVKEAKEAIKEMLQKRGGLSPKEVERYLYTYKGEEAIRHLFKVAASLDSLIIGEPQILGQVKDSYRLATEMGTTGPILNRALHFSFRAAKRVRTETGLANHAISVSYAAVELAKKIFGELEKKSALLIGAGEMAELAARHLIKNGLSHLLVANRTFARAQELAGVFRGSAIKFTELPIALMGVDIVISSTGASNYIVTPDMIVEALRRRRNRLLLMVDIAVPRDIDPQIGQMENVYLFDMEDLQDIADENMNMRQVEAKKAETIIDEETDRFMAWLKSLETVPTIIDLREKVESVMNQELERAGTWLRNLTDRDREEVTILLQSVINKILHDPITVVKEEHAEGGTINYVAALRRLFKLDEKTNTPTTGRKDDAPSSRA